MAHAAASSIQTITKTKTDISTAAVLALMAATATVTLGIFSGLAAVTLVNLTLPTTNLVGYWSFDNVENNNLAPDQVGTNPAAILNAPTPSTVTTDVIKGAGLVFNGSTYGLIVDNSGANDNPKSKTDCNINNSCKTFALDITRDITISAWVKRNSGTGAAGIVTKGNWIKTGTATDNRSYELAIDANNRFVFGVSKNGTDTSTTSLKVYSYYPVTNGQWYHVVGQLAYVAKMGTSDVYQLKLFINGVLQTSSFSLVVPAGTDPIYAGQANVIFGAFNAGDQYRLNGLIDEVRIYKGALSAADIKTLHIIDAADRPDLLIGKLNVSALNPPAQNVAQGSTGVTFTNLVFDATGSEKDIIITQLPLKIATADQAYPGLVSHIRFYDGGTEIIPSSSQSGLATTTFTFAPDVLRIPLGGSKTITVRVDIAKSNFAFTGNNDTIAVGLPESGLMAQDYKANVIVPTVTAGYSSAMTILPTIISNVQVSNISQNSATISFHVEGRVNCNTSVLYSFLTYYFDKEATTTLSNITNTGFDASVSLSNLEAYRDYYYKIIIDKSTNVEISYPASDVSFMTFKTLPPSLPLCSLNLDGIQYQIDPCEMNFTMNDGQGNLPFSFTLKQIPSPNNYSYAVVPYGIGYPTYGIICTGTGSGNSASQNVIINCFFSDSILNADGNSPHVYDGLGVIKVYHGNPSSTFIQLFPKIKLTVNPYTPAVCGNGIVETGEQCDDGNTVNGDGCSSTCTIENLPGGCTTAEIGKQRCTYFGPQIGGPATWIQVCKNTLAWTNLSACPNNLCCVTNAVCGNGIVETGEQCDDGNTTSGDACSATCQKTCTDSDVTAQEQGGFNFYLRGITTGWSNNQIISRTDDCQADGVHLNEYYCDYSNHLDVKVYSDSCTWGCNSIEGACNATTTAGKISLTGKTTPFPALVVAGTTAPVGKFIMKAKYAPLRLDNISFAINSPDSGIVGNANDITELVLYQDGVSAPIADHILLGTDNVHATATPATTLTLPQDTDVNFTLYAKFANLDSFSAAKSGDGVRFSVSNLTATDLNSGATASAIGIPATFNTFTLYKSRPIVDLVPIDTTSPDGYIGGNGWPVKIFNLKVTADAAGPISLYKLTFVVATTSVQLDPFGYYLLDQNSGAIVSKSYYNLYPSYSNSGGPVQLQVYFDPTNAVMPWKRQLIIDAGATERLSLYATTQNVIGNIVAGSYISTALVGDTAFATNVQKNAFGIDATINNHFIWSDLNSDLYNSTTATHTAMFYNGYRVSGTAMSGNSQIIIK